VTGSFSDSQSRDSPLVTVHCHHFPPYSATCKHLWFINTVSLTQTSALSSHLRLAFQSTLSLSFRLSNRNALCLLYLYYACYISHPSHIACFDHHNDIWRGGLSQISSLCSSVEYPYYFLQLRSQHFLPHPLHPMYVFTYTCSCSSNKMTSNFVAMLM
jgi:hypothetical protein